MLWTEDSPNSSISPSKNPNPMIQIPIQVDVESTFVWHFSNLTRKTPKVLIYQPYPHMKMRNLLVWRAIGLRSFKQWTTNSHSKNECQIVTQFIAKTRKQISGHELQEESISRDFWLEGNVHLQNVPKSTEDKVSINDLKSFWEKEKSGLRVIVGSPTCTASVKDPPPESSPKLIRRTFWTSVWHQVNQPKFPRQNEFQRLDWHKKRRWNRLQEKQDVQVQCHYKTFKISEVGYLTSPEYF